MRDRAESPGPFSRWRHGRHSSAFAGRAPIAAERSLGRRHRLRNGLPGLVGKRRFESLVLGKSCGALAIFSVGLTAILATRRASPVAASLAISAKRRSSE